MRRKAIETRSRLPQNKSIAAQSARNATRPSATPPNPLRVWSARRTSTSGLLVPKYGVPPIIPLAAYIYRIGVGTTTTDIGWNPHPCYRSEQALLNAFRNACRSTLMRGYNTRGLAALFQSPVPARDSCWFRFQFLAWNIFIYRLRPCLSMKSCTTCFFPVFVSPFPFSRSIIPPPRIPS